MKRMMIGAAAAVAAFAAVPAFAGNFFSFGIFSPAPVVYQPAPVAYYQPVQPVYYGPARPYYAPHRHWVREDRRFQVGYWDGGRRDGRWDRDDRRYR